VSEDERRRAPRRVLIRLKHSLAADEEINAVLPDTLEEFDDALARGELRELKASLNDVLDRKEKESK
jgi:hypothetical protein